MQSLSNAFNHASGIDTNLSFWLLLWMLFIDDDRQNREKEQRRKRLASKEPPHRRPLPKCPAPKPAFGKRRSPAPRPF
jgi:hypothetical protein